VDTPLSGPMAIAARLDAMVSELIDGIAVASPSAGDMEERDNVTSAIQVYGTSWCRLTYRVREYLMHARLTYEFFDIDHDQKAHEFVLATTNGQRRFPLVVVENDVMTVPTIPQLQRVLDAHDIRSERAPSRRESMA
jgi:glutaredoxin